MSADAKTIKAIFLGAIDRATSADRAAYLDEACNQNPELRQSVEDLLRSHEEPDSLLDKPAVTHLETEGENPSLDFLEPAEAALGRLGHYEVKDVIGRGGMGVVMRAIDGKLLRVVAIKALNPALAGGRESRQRVVREAQAAAAVTHDNVISIHAVEDGGRVPYIVMQYIDGCTLQQKLDRGAPLPLKEILRIGLQIAEGLAAAHRHGLIHRDIKPANILLENGVERVRITDFGLARAADDASLTRSGYIAGTPAYMSPEQANGARVDHRCDLFSLGSVLYAMCAGSPPFQADTAMAVLKQVCEHTPRPLRELNPDTPDWLQSLVAKLHAKSPSDRYSSAAEVAAILSRRLSELQSEGKFSDADGPTTEARFPGKVLAKRRAALWIVAALVLLGGGSWLAYQFWRGNPSESAQARPDPPTKNGGSSKETTPAPAMPVVQKPTRTLMQHARGVRVLAFSRDGKVMASGGGDRHIYLWDTKTWEARGPLKGHAGEVAGLSFSPDGTRLASVCSSTDTCLIRVWDVAIGQEVAKLGPANPGMWDVAYSTDGQTLACGGWDRTLHLYDVASGTERLKIPNIAKRLIREISISPDGQQIATGGNGRTQLWDAMTGEEIITRVHVRDEMCPTILPGGKGLVGWCYSEGRVVICDLPSGGVRDWRAHPKTIEGLAVSTDGQFLATIGNDGEARIWSLADWSLADQREVARLIGHKGAVYAVAFSPDGTQLVTGGDQDFTIRVWDLTEMCRTAK